MMSTVQFSLVGPVADVDGTLPGDPDYPAMILVLDAGRDLMSVIVPPSAWSRPPELLQVGREVRIVGDMGPMSRPRAPVAHHVELVGPLH